MTEFRLDWQRAERTGLAEAVLCEPKSAAQIDAIVAHAIELDERLLLTRLGPRKLTRLAASARSVLDYDAVSRTAILGGIPEPRATGRVAFETEGPTLVHDVGVAGLWRLIERLDEIRGHRVVIAVAGMEGALFSVLAGLVPGAVVAVPTSIGYGVGKGGRTALNAALASCASGLVVVNIDNGFGAAHAALRILGRNPVAA